MPASLVECGFMDSSTDIRYILDPEWSRKAALGIAEGICEVFGGSVSEEIDEVKDAEESKEPEETGSVIYAESFDRSYAGTYAATVSDLKFREGPNSRYSVIDSLNKGERVRCYGYYTKETDGTVWLYVQYNGQSGYISERYLVKN